MSDLTDIHLLLTTVATREDAQTLARAMVEQGLAACVQLQAIESVYRWSGALQEESEWRLLFKTGAARVAELKAAVAAQHPYELPAIVTLKADANDAFGAWVAAETARLLSA